MTKKKTLAAVTDDNEGLRLVTNLALDPNRREVRADGSDALHATLTDLITDAVGGAGGMLIKGRSQSRQVASEALRSLAHDLGMLWHVLEGWERLPLEPDWSDVCESVHRLRQRALGAAELAERIDMCEGAWDQRREEDECTAAIDETTPRRGAR